MESVSLLQLNQFIRQSIGLNFPDAIWVAAEVSEVSESKGHFFFSLWQKDVESERVIAQARAVVWAKDHRRLRRSHGKAFSQVLKQGQSVRLLAEVQFHEQFGMGLHIKDLDTAWTVGQLALKKQKSFEQLEAENLLGLNGKIPLPKVLQRIAVISSANAAGLQDFEHHLSENPLGYAFHTQLFATAVQGEQVEAELHAALRSIQNLQAAFDCVVILRGGGARAELSAFDSLALSRQVAKFPLPVLVGVGHQTDTSLLDAVAAYSLKTPTAAADFLIQHNARFEQNLLDMHQALGNRMREVFFKKASKIERIDYEIHTFSQFFIQKKQMELNAYALRLDSMNPKNILKRGYSLTLKEGKTVTSPAQINRGDRVRTHTKDGSFDSVVD